ncbi:MAG: hypothetical protein AAFQ64_11840 [Pseudomonadota bacterium]
MTALDRFIRLESGGLWREDKDAQRRDVTVSFGKTTLVLSDGAGRAMTHWSLPAIQRLNPGTRPALYAPDRDAIETIEIEDDLMIDAIEEVRNALLAAQPHPGRVRGYLTAATFCACIIAAIAWAPGAMRDKAIAVVPEAKRQEIGATILGHYQRLTGPSCRSAEGSYALAQLFDRLFGDDANGQLVVVQQLPQGAAALPGGLILIDRRLVEDYDDPAVVAGFVLASAAPQRAGVDRLKTLLNQAPLSATMTLLTTGDMTEAPLRAEARALQAGADMDVTPESLRVAFAQASLPPRPYLAQTNASAATLAAFDGFDLPPQPAPILDDSAWVRLQSICDQ